jgi:predicted PurR-regulated permease PerM
MKKGFNNRIKQVLFLIFLLALVMVVLAELYTYLPGMLAAVTLYILSREKYFQIIYRRKWQRGWAAALFVLYYFLLIGLPVYLAITLISPKINAVMNDPTATIATAKTALLSMQDKLGFKFLSERSVNSAVEKVSSILPSLFTSTATVITNLTIMLFLLYYMLYSGSAMEKTLFRIIPLKDENTKLLAAETKTVIKSNAIGIPLISLIQGITAAIGYWIFGMDDVFLWGFLTGVFSFLPVIGTMIIWVPLCIYMYTTGDTGMAIGLTLYSAIVTANIDYFARISIMKKLGDVHPVITLFGIIVGLNLFGFIGLVFGPLLINYIIVLFTIYMNEFVERPDVVPEVKENETPETVAG